MKHLLMKVNKLFEGGLISSNIDDYLKKIQEKAKIISICERTNLLGFIAYYDNDDSLNLAFLTMIVVDPACIGRGYGDLLIKSSILDLKKKGFKLYRLKVLKNNIRAIKLYEKHGFTNIGEVGEHYIYQLNL